MRCDDARALLDAVRYAGEEGAALDAPGAAPARANETRASTPHADVAPVLEARAHVGSCAECQAHLARSESLDRVLALDDTTPPGPGFDTRFFARLDEERTARKRRGLWRWAWALVPVGVAAGLALMRAPAAPPPDRDPTMPLADLPQGDIALMMELELVEELEVVERLDELEAFELFEDVDDATLDAIMQEVE